MAHAFEFGMTLQTVKLSAQTRIGQIDPAHYAANESIRFGQLQQPVRFREQSMRLHHHGTIESIACQDRLKLPRQEIASQRRWRRRHPGILKTLEIPEMLVRVYPHSSIIK